MALTVVAESDNEEFGAVEDALDLQREEFGAAGAEGGRGVVALLVDERVDVAAQGTVGDADEPPGLHQPHAWRGVGGGEQAREHLFGNGCPRCELAHVAAFRDRAVHGAAFGVAERPVGHVASLGGSIDRVSEAIRESRDSTRDNVLISPADLRELLAAGTPVTVLDVRWQLAKRDGTDDYEAGHLPGAVYVSLEDELSDHGVEGRGRHPLPCGAAVQRAARRWGVRTGVPVVVYDDWNRAGSSRAWWVLTAAGIPGVRILDGGLAAWVSSGGAIETGSTAMGSGDSGDSGDIVVGFEDLYRGALPAVTADEAAAARLLDARAPERFRGEVEPVDPVAGHVPGARNVPSTSLLDAEGAFLGERELREAAGDATAVYCGSGVTASVVVAALASAGTSLALFPGSWSQWCTDAGRPVATGE